LYGVDVLGAHAADAGDLDMGKSAQLRRIAAASSARSRFERLCSVARRPDIFGGMLEPRDPLLYLVMC
jgi:hypothetical protein